MKLRLQLGALNQGHFDKKNRVVFRLAILYCLFY